MVDFMVNVLYYIYEVYDTSNSQTGGHEYGKNNGKENWKLCLL